MRAAPITTRTVVPALLFAFADTPARPSPRRASAPKRTQPVRRDAQPVVIVALANELTLGQLRILADACARGVVGRPVGGPLRRPGQTARG